MVRPRILFSPKMIYSRLKEHFDKNSIQCPISKLLHVVKRELPIRISMRANNVICQPMPNRKGVWTREEQMIPCLIDFSTRHTALDHPHERTYHQLIIYS